MIPGVVGSSQYVVPASGTFGLQTPGSGTGTVGPRWNPISGYVYWDDGQADIMSASPFPSNTFSDSITTGLGTSANYDAVSQMSYENGYIFLAGAGNLAIYRINPNTYSVAASTGTFSAGPNQVVWFPPTSEWIAVGDSGRWWKSTDGAAWTQQTAIGAVNWNAVATDGTLLVFMSNSGTCQTSTDASTFTSRTSSFGTSAVYRIFYVNSGLQANVSGTKGVWFATGAGGLAAYSTNGTTWTQKTTGAGGNIMMSAYHMGRFFALGNASGQTLRRSDTSDPSGTWAAVSATSYSDAQSGGSSGGYLYFIETAGKFHYVR